MLFVLVCVPVHVYSQSGRCWTAIVMVSMSIGLHWASGGHDSLLAGCNCKVQEAWKSRQCTVAEAQSHDKGKGGRTVAGVHESLTEMENTPLNGGMEKRVGTEV